MRNEMMSERVLKLFSPEIQAHVKSRNMSFDFLTTFWVMSFGVVGFIVAPLYMIFTHNNSLGPWITALVLYWLAGLAITMGYHRYFSHRSFDCSKWIEFVLLLLGAMGLENSALKWSSDHRKHHSFTDTEQDPYNAKLGFWWSHMVWIFFSEGGEKGGSHMGRPKTEAELVAEYPNCRDLIKSPLVRLQHTYAIPFGFVLCFGVPLLIGFIMGQPLAYLLVGGFTRVAAMHHSTYFINSLAHIWGRKPHSPSTTAVDNPYLAFLALGEGYHNYHHTFPSDYRNGIRAHHFDPTKWIIRSLSYVGATWNLKRARNPENRSQEMRPET
jgi:stearoyl-CoA desaturase (delta-9 desaturase)